MNGADVRVGSYRYLLNQQTLIKFQPDGSSGAWHAYKVVNTKSEVPTNIYRQMLKDGRISKADYKRLISNNWNPNKSK